MNQAEKLTQKADNTELVSVPNLIQNSIPELSKMLGEDEGAAIRFARIITTDMRTNPKLANCSPLSLMGAMFTAAELKLEPVNGRAYILPFDNKRKIDGQWKTITEAQFVLGYKGIVDLFYRHASALSLQWGVVHKNDHFEFSKGSENYLNHRRGFEERGEKIAYWVGAKVNGEFLFEVMSYDECIEHGHKHSKSSYKGKFNDSSPWIKSEDSMCLKTVLIQLSKTLPLSVEIQRALQADETTRHVPVQFDVNTDQILELPDQTNWEKDEPDEV